MKRLPAQHHLGAALFGWVGLPMMMALLWGQPKDGAAAAWCVGNGALGMVALGASVAIHELAHAAVAVLLRLEVASVSIGVGPVISRRRVRAVDVALHAVPTAGLVMLVANSRRWLRTRVWWTIFAGPAVNLGIAAVVLSWLASTGGNVARVEFTSGLAWWLVFGATNLGVGALNIFPSGSTDGAQLLSGLFGGHDANRTLGAGHLQRGDRALAAGRYDEALAEAEAARPLLKKDSWARWRRCVRCATAAPSTRARPRSSATTSRGRSRCAARPTTPPRRSRYPRPRSPRSRAPRPATARTAQR